MRKAGGLFIGKSTNSESNLSLFTNRCGHEVTYDILRLIEKGDFPKTKIMFSTDLNSKQIDLYRTILLGAGLISTVYVGKNPYAKRYRRERWAITPKGLNYLQDFDRLQAYFKTEQ